MRSQKNEELGKLQIGEQEKKVPKWQTSVFMCICLSVLEILIAGFREEHLTQWLTKYKQAFLTALLLRQLLSQITNIGATIENSETFSEQNQCLSWDQDLGLPNSFLAL